MSGNGYRWLTPLSQQFLEKDYLLPGQTVDERVDVIGARAEKLLQKPGFAGKFKDYFKRGWFSLSTPIWANFGTERGLPISCFGSFISDSMQSILQTHAEVGMMTKYGGGTAAYFGELRCRGQPIKDNGESSGAVHFMRMFESLLTTVSQGATRRGNFAAYLPIDHCDIQEFLTLRTEGSPIQDLSYGVCIPDYWMEEMIAGDQKKRVIWAKVLESRTNTGYPYLFFTDNANKNKPQVYKDKNLFISHSQLCVTGDQRVVSDRGLKTAKELWEEGGELTLFDNEKAVKASAMQLVEKNADVYRIHLDNGMTHDVTSYHKVKVAQGERKWVMKECRQLEEGDRVAIQTQKGLFGSTHMPDEAFLLGLYQGDGTQTEESVALEIWEGKTFDLEDEIQGKYNRIVKENKLNVGVNSRVYNIPKFFNCSTGTSTVAKKRLMGTALKKFGFQKGVVPKWIWEGTEDTQWEYVRGLFYTDGTVSFTGGKGEAIQLAVSSVDKEYLRKVQLILNNLGVKTSIRLLREAGKTWLPDGKGGQKQYECQDCWRLIVGNKPDCLKFNTHTGFLDRKEVSVQDREYRDNTKKAFKVNQVEYLGKQDVYCCKVDSDEHLWICNGVVTSNCTEIFLPSGPDESFVCDLASANCLYYEEWKSTDLIEVIVYLLDAVLTEFISKAQSIPFMERPVRFAKRHRALGIGQLGWHSFLQSKGIPFESMEAKRYNLEIAKVIEKAALAASKKMASEYGEPELLKGYGLRHTTLTAIAPTKSSSFILGQVSEGIEPIRSNYYVKDLAKGKFTIKNQYLETLLEERKQNTPEVWESVLKNSGSVQHLKFLTEREKGVFKTFAEISPMEIVNQAAQRQKHIDQGQSLNLLIDPKTPVKDVNALIIEGWRSGLKSLYYQISVNAAQQLQRSILSCSSCEA